MYYTDQVDQYQFLIVGCPIIAKKEIKIYLLHRLYKNMNKFGHLTTTHIRGGGIFKQTSFVTSM